MNILDLMNKMTELSQPLLESESEVTHKGGVKTTDDSGVKHKGKYGNEYQGDDEEEEDNGKKKKAAPAGEKRGRGRPKKGADNAGVVNKPDWSQFGVNKDAKLKPWDKAKTTKHSMDKKPTLKDWIENLDKALNEGGQMTATPLPGATAIKNAQGQQVATATTPQAAAMMTKGEVQLTDPTKELGEEKNHMGETQYNTYFGWKVASRKAGAKSFTGDRDIDQGLDASGKGVSEWDGASGSVYGDAHKKKPAASGMNESQSSGNIDALNKQSRGLLANKGKKPADKAKSAEKAPAVKKIKESAMSELDLNLKDPKCTEADFKKEYGMTKAEMRAKMKDKKSPAKKTSKLKESILKESHETLAHIINKFKHEVKKFVSGEEMDSDLYDALYDYYCDMGEMPYGTMKARDGDPMEWVSNRFDQDVQDHNVPIDEEVRPENVPAVQRKQAGSNFPATLDQVNKNDSLSHLPNLRQVSGPGSSAPVDEQVLSTSHIGKTTTNPFGAGPAQGSVQFESWNNQLNSLIEGMNVVANTGLGDAPDSVTISATDEEAAQLLAIVKSAGLGMFAADEQSQQNGQPGAVDGVVTSEPGAAIDVVDDHDGMLSLIKKMTGQGEAPVQASGPESGEQAVDEEEEVSPENYDSDWDYEDAQNSRNANSRQDDDDGKGGGDAAWDDEDYSEDDDVNEEDNYPTQQERSDHQEQSTQSDGLDEEKTCEACTSGNCQEHGDKEEVEEAYENGAEDTFEADIDFMQNVISGGMNGQKRNQSVGAPISVASTPVKEASDLLKDWKKLSGI